MFGKPETEFFFFEHSPYFDLKLFLGGNRREDFGDLVLLLVEIHVIGMA